MKTSTIYNIAFAVITLFTVAAPATIAAQNSTEQQTETTAEVQKKAVSLTNINEINIFYGDCFFVNNAILPSDYTAFGVFSVTYQHHLKKWLSVGATLSYIPSSKEHYKTIYDNTGGNDFLINDEYTTLYRNNLSFATDIRFYFYNNGLIRMYGGVALGYMFEFSEDDFKSNIFFQPTFFGFSVGKKFVFGCEIGCGSKGIFNTYIGYKF